MELIQQYRVHAPQMGLRHEKALSQREAVGYGAAVIERLLFAVRTRHDGDFYQAVAESLKYAFEVEG